MVHRRVDHKETDEQKDEDHETKIVDVNFWSVYFLWICSDQKYYGVSIWIRLFRRSYLLYKI